MNWTGGRLRRQSHNRPDSLLRIQKQYFAKERLKKQELNNKKAAISHLRSTPNPRDNSSAEPRHYSTRNDDASWTTRQTEQAINPTVSSLDVTHESQKHRENMASANRSVIKPNSNSEVFRSRVFMISY